MSQTPDIYGRHIVHPDFVMTPAQCGIVADWLARMIAVGDTPRIDELRRIIRLNARKNDRRLFATFLAGWRAGIDAELCSVERRVALVRSVAA